MGNRGEEAYGGMRLKYEWNLCEEKVETMRKSRRGSLRWLEAKVWMESVRGETRDNRKSRKTGQKKWHFYVDLWI